MSRGRPRAWGRSGELGPLLASLEAASTEQLRSRWQAVYRAPPPMGLSRNLLCRALAWELQAAREGGLSARTERVLQGGVDAAVNAKLASPNLKPGTRLVRQWQGKMHHVLVLDDGVDYDGTRFESLSAVARHITGTRWSGPRFFGLKPVGGGDA